MPLRRFLLPGICFLFLESIAQKNEPYTKFIENNTKINWAAEYRSIVNLTPITNTVSLKKYYLTQLTTKGLKSYTIVDRRLTDSSIIKDPNLQRQDWLKDHYVRPSDRADRWEYRSRKNSTGYRISGISNDPCCGCDEADAFLVNQLLLYSNARFTTKNIYLSPLCLRKTGDEHAAWYPPGNFAWNASSSRSAGSTYLTKSSVTYQIDPYDSLYDPDILTLGDNLLVNHLLKDVQSGKVTAHDYDSDKKIAYDELLTWNMPYDTIAVYDDDMNVSSYQVVQQVLDAKAFSSIRLEQDWYFDFKKQMLFSEVRSATLLIDKRLPDGRVIGKMPFARLKFKPA